MRLIHEGRPLFLPQNHDMLQRVINTLGFVLQRAVEGLIVAKNNAWTSSKIDQIVENVVTSASTRRYAAKGCVWTYMLTRSIVASVIMNAKKEVHALMECATMLKLGHCTFIEVKFQSIKHFAMPS